MPIYNHHRSRKQEAGEARARRNRENDTNQANSSDSKSGSESGFRVGQTLTGVASFYGPGFHGRLTANGETYDQNGLTCAHRSLPFGTMLKVTVLKTGKSVLVRVNDRGPYVEGRFLDLSVGAARRLGILQEGTVQVSATIIRLGNP